MYAWNSLFRNLTPSLMSCHPNRTVGFKKKHAPKKTCSGMLPNKAANDQATGPVPFPEASLDAYLKGDNRPLYHCTAKEISLTRQKPPTANEFSNQNRKKSEQIHTVNDESKQT